jgi:putative transposase
VQRTITLHLPAEERLVRTIETVNDATNDILVVGFKAGVVNKLKLHHLTYYPVRERYPGIPASLVTTARDNASEMLKREKLARLPVNQPNVAICFGHSETPQSQAPSFRAG